MLRSTLPLSSEARKDVPLFRGLLRYFPAALAAVAKVSKIGNDKHNPGEEMHHARGKSMDHADCIMRHLVDLGENGGYEYVLDSESGDILLDLDGTPARGTPQVYYIAWRALALAQEWCEKNEGAPLAPGAKAPTCPTAQAIQSLQTLQLEQPGMDLQEIFTRRAEAIEREAHAFGFTETEENS